MGVKPHRDTQVPFSSSDIGSVICWRLIMLAVLLEHCLTFETFFIFVDSHLSVDLVNEIS